MANEKRLIDAVGAMRNAILLDGILSVPIFCIESTPTVDAVEVVRCKDCNHYMYEEYCGLLYGMDRRNPGDFCSYGERKSDGQT